MELRKEQILFVLALVVGLVLFSGRETPTLRSSARPRTILEFEPPPAPVPNVPSLGEVGLRGLLFREPTEAIPLPPRSLPTPALAQLPLVWPPLPIGQSSGAMYQLVADGVVPIEHEFQPFEPAAPPVEFDPGIEALDPESDPFFDQVWREGQSSSLRGRILDQDALSLEGASVPRPFEFQFYNRETRTPNGSPLLIEDALRVRLADSLENRIERRRRAVLPGPAGTDQRIELIRWLLEEARTEPSVYVAAEEQARLIAQDEARSMRGHLWLIRVLRAQGDPVREFEFYRSQKDRGLDSSDYLQRERARFAQSLTLDGIAEAGFRRAIELAPVQAQNHAALAEFLLERGRLVEAREQTARALSTVGSVSGVAERAQVYATAVRVALAVGDVKDAERSLNRLSGGLSALETKRLQAAVAYANGDVATALTKFRELYQAGDAGSLLGLGCAAMRAGNFDEALFALDRAIEEAPLLRGRTQAARAALFEVTAHPDRSSEAMNLAVTAAPDDFYVRYIAGRRHRLNGDPDAALESLRGLLAERDDFGMALAEAVRSLLARAESLDEEGGQSLADAARYADSLVDLDQEQSDAAIFFELQGLAHSRAGNLGPARRAWRTAAERGSDFADLGLAVLDYRSGRARSARERLIPITSDPSRLASTKTFAIETIQRIDDHAAKEQVLDNFDRESIGEFWTRDGALRPSIQDDRVAFKSRDDRRATGELSRSVPGQDFLSVAVTLQMEQSAGTDFAGLRLQLDKRPFSIDLGFVSTSRVGGLAPRLILEDGRDDDGPLQVDLSDLLGDLDRSGEHRLEVEAVPFIDPESGQTGNQLGLVVRWNGQEIYRVERTKSLRARGGNNEMKTILRASGTGVDLRFDDFRLVRRRADA